MNLNNLLSLDAINSMDSHNSCNAQVIDNENKLSNKDIFFKFSPSTRSNKVYDRKI